VLLSQFPDTNSVFQPKGVRSPTHKHVCSLLERFSNHVFTRANSNTHSGYISRSSEYNNPVTIETPVYCCDRNNAACLHCYPSMMLRPSSIVALLRKRNNVVLVHCCNSANVAEPREPYTCNNIIPPWLSIFIYNLGAEQQASWLPQFRDIVPPHRHDHEQRTDLLCPRSILHSSLADLLRNKTPARRSTLRLTCLSGRCQTAYHCKPEPFGGTGIISVGTCCVLSYLVCRHLPPPPSQFMLADQCNP
jgi:hypothetical protein